MSRPISSPSRNANRKKSGLRIRESKVELKRREEKLSRALEQPGYLIRRLHQTAAAMFLERTARYELTPVQYATLAAIDAARQIDQQSVAQKIGVDRTTMNDVAKRLASKGWVDRVKGKGRRLDLTLTFRGEHMLAEAGKALVGVGNQLLRPLTQTQRKDFIAALFILARAYHAI